MNQPTRTVIAVLTASAALVFGVTSTAGAASTSHHQVPSSRTAVSVVADDNPAPSSGTLDAAV